MLKLKQKPGLVIRKENPAQLRLTTTATNAAEEPKNKKPKINFIIQSPPSSQKQQPKVQTTQILASSTPKATFTSPSKAQILNIEKIPPVTTQASPTKQLFVPIMVRSDGTRNTLSANDATAQLIQQALMSAQHVPTETKPASNQPFMLMKIQSNADGQFTLMPATQLAPPPQPQQLQLQLSSQQLQQLGLQTLQPTQQTISMQPTQLTIPTQIAQTTVTPAPKQETQTTQTVKEITVEETTLEDEEIYDPNNYDDTYYEGEESIHEESMAEEEKVQDDKKTPKKKPIKFTKKSKQIDSYEEPPVNPEHSEIAKKQMAQITNYNAKRNPDESDSKSDINLTVCDVS